MGALRQLGFWEVWQVAPNGPQCRVKDQFTHHQADVWSSFPEPGPKPGSRGYSCDEDDPIPAFVFGRCTTYCRIHC